MSLHAWRRQGTPKPSSCAAFTLSPHWGRAATGKKSLVSMQAGFLQSCPTLCDPADPARLLCQGGSPGKNTGAYWPKLVVMPSQSTVFPAALAASSLSTWCCQNPWDPSSGTTSSPGPHRGRPKPSGAASGASPSGRPTCRGGNKTTVETQCG